LKLNLSFSLFLTASLFAGSASALPVNSSRALLAAPASTLEAINFEGIIKLDNCSGSLVRYEKSLDSDQAMVMTNGHCHSDGLIDPNTFILNKESNRRFSVLKPTDGSSLGTITAEKILYGTMTKTDMMLYRVKETYADIKAKFGVRPLTLSSRIATPGTKIEIVSGYWKTGYACEIEYLVNTIREDAWTFRNSIRYTRPGCKTIHGTSGSPIIAAGTDQVIGINNTGNDNGEKCTMDNPCEIDAEGKITYEKGVSYGQQIALVYSCLDSQLRLDLSISTCRLPGGAMAGSSTIRVR